MHPSPIRTLVSASAFLAMVVSLALLAAVPAAHARAGDFSSSFESGDVQPAWMNTVETNAAGDKRAAGVTGPARTGIPGNVSDRVVAVRASAENPPGEVKENLVDGSAQTKWLAFSSTAWLEFELNDPVVVVRYALTAANDSAERDPKDWTLSGSNDGHTWTPLDHQSGQEFPERFQTKEFGFANATAYRHYRVDILANHSGGLLQLAEVQLSNGDTTPPPPSDMTSKVGNGPRGGYTAKSGAGFTGLKAFQYAGAHTSDARGYSTNKIFDVNVPVSASTELSYLIFPDFETDDLSYPSTYTSLDLAFTDGTYLSDLKASDQHGATLSPRGQAASKTLFTNQWNAKRSRIGAVAAGKTIDRILVAYDNPDGPADFGGWIDDVKIQSSPLQKPRSGPSDWVTTTRGTNSTGGYSRGNNIPATAMPHGFNFWTPVTDAGSLSWLYDYHRDNNAQNLPTLEAFAASHEPSPWMGDRQTFQVMPSAAGGAPDTGRAGRALAFRHENEVALPHHYGVKFENGIKTDIAPTDHAAVFRFAFPDEKANLVFDNVNNSAGLTIDRASGVVSGYSDTRSGLSNGATRLFVYATFDKPITASATSGIRTGYAKFDAGADRTVTMRIATSLISQDQARKNLALEIAPTDTFADVEKRAQAKWDGALGVIEVEGATEDQRTTLYSNLYRLSLYPNSAHENTGTRESPIYKHAVQSSTTTPASTPTQTGAPVVDGKVYVNNGFWDTYRTTWSAYSLFSPGMAGEMVDGFVQQYRDGGWVSRWSSPGYANLMTGTSSDVAFADAYVKGVRGFDAQDAYDAALKNATVAPPGSDPKNPSVGRKGLISSIFKGYTSSDVGEGVSWALEGYINDYGIANMAGKMAEDPHASAAERARLSDEHEYFLSRSLGYVNMFDPRIKFFQGRAADGTWNSTPKAYDPLEWGHGGDYTETDGWNFAFHAPQDGQGLANLYGGRKGLETKLDTFFSTPETAKHTGSYGGTIHEMIEARDVRMGQWGFSNQVSHHIPYMYDYAGRPAKTQEKVREALRRLYVGSEIGQGYAGDEDNGETSAWYLFSALGFYPLQVGSPNYAIGSPLFKKATVHQDNGHDIVIKAPRNSQDNVYVQGLKVNGVEHNVAWLSHATLAKGATLDFDMGPAPSKWATGEHAAPPSITKGEDAPQPMHDVTGADGDSVTASPGAAAGPLFDNTSGTRVTLAGIEPWVEYRFAHDEKRQARFYTLTSADTAGADPSNWVVKGSNDGKHWRVVDDRRGETFKWRSQTRPFKLDRPSNFSRFRIDFGSGPVTLAEMELLSDKKQAATPLEATVGSSVGKAGETISVPVTLSNWGDAPLKGTLGATVPQGWTVTPASVAFGPVAGGGGSTTVKVNVVVPADAKPGSYPINVTVTAGKATAKAVGAMNIVGDTIDFAPGSDAEAPWLFDAGGSQLGGDVPGGRARFADNAAAFVYRFELGGDVTGGTLSLELRNEYLVQTSTDGKSWKTALQETRRTTDGSNQAVRTLPISGLASAGQALYVRIADNFPEDGWGGWLARVKLETTKG